MKDNLNTIKCLDKGFVRLVDYMGDDSSIVQAARVSYGKGTKTIEEDTNLIRYLMNKKHTSPFEQVVFQFHVKAPIFIFRQWHRHRTSSINEISYRYSTIKEEFYLPQKEDLKYQSKDNKQCRDDMVLDDDSAEMILAEMKEIQRLCFNHYNNLINIGLAREIARINIPVSIYSEMYWKMDLHNLFHFLKLRKDKHAQKEIRDYADAIYELIKPIVPIACEAFDNYLLNGVSSSKQEIDVLEEIFNELNMSDKIKQHVENSNLSKREKNEFLKKFDL